MDEPNVPRSLNLADFDEMYQGKRIYKLTLKSPVTQTGAAVTNTYKIPFPHRLVRVDVKHCDSSDADCTDAFTWSLSHQQVKALFAKIIDESNSTVTDFMDTLGESYEFTGMLYKFITNTTATDLVYLTLTIQLTRSFEEMERDKHGRQA